MGEGIVKSLKFSEGNTTFHPETKASSTPYSISESYSHYMTNLVGRLEIEPVPVGFSTTGQGVTTEGHLSGGSYTSSLATEKLIQMIHLDFFPSLAVQTSFDVNPVTGEVSNGSQLGKTTNNKQYTTGSNNIEIIP